MQLRNYANGMSWVSEVLKLNRKRRAVPPTLSALGTCMGSLYMLHPANPNKEVSALLGAYPLGHIEGRLYSQDAARYSKANCSSLTRDTRA